MKSLICISAIMIFGVSCASRHSSMRGTVAMKIDENHGIACVEPGLVKEGEKLVLMNNECDRDYPMKDIGSACKLVKSGEVKVTKMLNEHYAQFETVSNEKFSEGSIIQDTK